MAGPVVNNRIEVFANLPWNAVDGDKIRDSFGMERFTFINDFVAAGYGVATLTDAEIERVHGCKEAKPHTGAKSVRYILGPGTGFG